MFTSLFLNYSFTTQNLTPAKRAISLGMISSAALASSKRKRSSLGSNSSPSASSKEPEHPSKIPVKTPAGLGGMAVAYSPAPAEPASSIATNSITTNPEDYSRKLQELRTAMELLKTPPKKNQVTPSISTSSPLNRSWSLEHLAEKPGESSVLRMNSFVSESSSEAEAEEQEEIQSIISRLDRIDSEPPSQSFVSSSPSSPLISAEELKRRLEATREAFQRSLAQVNSSPSRMQNSHFGSDEDVLAQLERRGSQLRHVPVTFDDLEEEAQRQLDEIERESKESINAEKAEMAPTLDLNGEEGTIGSTSSNWLIFAFSAFIVVGMVALAAVLKIQVENGNLSVEKILVQAEALLNYILQDD